jgi:hypothetical protein
MRPAVSTDREEFPRLREDVDEDPEDVDDDLQEERDEPIPPAVVTDGGSVER